MFFGATSAILLLAQAHAGVIDVDTVWTAAGSPWQVGEVTTATATLTIEPGATVALGAGASLIVEGALIARGTAEEPILFTGESWGSVVFADSSEDAVYERVDDYVSGSVIEHAIIEGGSQAVVTEAASPYLHRVVFRDNYYAPPLTVGGAALLVGPDSAPRVVGCTFEDNEAGAAGHGGAVYVDDANPILQGNTFRRNQSVYGGALTTFAMSAPIVGNVFEDNGGAFEGGAMSLVSSSPAVLDNEITGNHAILDGGGIHVCVTCYPHAFPFILDNTITGNANNAHGAAGVGSAHLRALSHNDIHDNVMGEDTPADFAWHNEELDWAPEWVYDPLIAENWWGTTSVASVAETVHDGNDDETVGTAWFLPVAAGPIAAPRTRATVTTMKYWYYAEGEPMPVYLTLYNPGPEREVELAILLQYEEDAPVFWQGDIGFPGAERSGDTWRLTLPENSVWYETLTLSAYRETPFSHGTWHVALFDDAGPVGDLLSARFDLVVPE